MDECDFKNGKLNSIYKEEMMAKFNTQYSILIMYIIYLCAGFIVAATATNRAYYW